MKSVGIRLWDKGRLYFYNPTEFDLARDEWVLVKTERALTPAKVHAPSRPLLPLLEKPSLRPVTRKATERDLVRIQECLAIEPKIRDACQGGIATHRLAMRLSDVEILFDKSKP